MSPSSGYVHTRCKLPGTFTLHSAHTHNYCYPYVTHVRKCTRLSLVLQEQGRGPGNEAAATVGWSNVLNPVPTLTSHFTTGMCSSLATLLDSS